MNTVTQALQTLHAQHGVDVTSMVQQLDDLASVQITNAEDYRDAGDAVVLVSKVGSRLEEERVRLVAPFLAQQRALQALFKPLQAQVDTCKNALKRSMLHWKAEQDRIQQEALRHAAALAAEVRITEPPPQHHAAVQAALVAAHQAAPPAVKGVSTSRVTKFEVVDAALVPREYLVVDERLVREAVKAGKNVPGVRVWEEDVMTVRSA